MTRRTVNLRESCLPLRVPKFHIAHGREHSIQWLARDLNVDRLSLAGGLLGDRASAVEAKRKFTVVEAFESWTARSEGEESRNRKGKALAEAAENPEQQGFGASCYPPLCCRR